MKPLLMMRTKGVTGPFVSKHCGVPKLSKSAGNSPKNLSLHATGAWTGTENCEAIGQELVTVRFNRDVVFIDGTVGVSITHSNGGTFTITGVLGNGTNLLEYEGTLDVPLTGNDIVTYEYDGQIGNYQDDTGTSLANQSLNITNCSA